MTREVPKTRFFNVFGVFWALLIFGSKGGAKIFGRVVRGGRTKSDASLGGRTKSDRRYFWIP